VVVATLLVMKVTGDEKRVAQILQCGGGCGIHVGKVRRSKVHHHLKLPCIKLRLAQGGIQGLTVVAASGLEPSIKSLYTYEESSAFFHKLSNSALPAACRC
jgi:hypothetical protein